ncbi:MAG TPA: dCMP deaminase family protein [Vicinamibacteria bacterium]|nr:dCMP deaminase family protein [Vicinamibacteria bacterium]
MSGRPGWDAYYLSIARTVSARSNCVRRRVGAVIVVDKAIIATGYNGTPLGVRNCAEGGCPRCASEAPPGAGYDACICVHAEQNAIVLAARHGNATNGGLLYTTLRPCFGCAKEAIQAGLRELVFAEPFGYGPELEDVYRRLIAESGVALRQAQEASAG